jgi:D-glycero-alpha-D-manno-heptose-7-phosphate kinase
MIISRTPYRVSFFGGGTDYHTWYEKHGGKILSTTISHYSYVSARFLPPFFKYKYRFTWNDIVETLNSKSETSHGIIRSALDFLKIESGIEISHQEDIPSKSGIGSSSTFAVGLLNSLYALTHTDSTKQNLACEAVYLEREMLKDSIGVQDQIAASYGGLNKIEIKKDGTFSVTPLTLKKERVKELESHMLLFFTGISRKSTEVASKKIDLLAEKEATLRKMSDLVDKSIDILSSPEDICSFGELLHKTWILKQSISSHISNKTVDYMYSRARNAGAIGGKLLGAGGGGFVLFFAKPEDHPKVKEALKEFLWVPFEFESNGSQIIFHDNPKYSLTSSVRRDFYHLTNQRLTNIKRNYKELVK